MDVNPVHVPTTMLTPRSEASSVLNIDDAVGGSDVSMPAVRPSGPLSFHNSSSSDSDLEYDKSESIMFEPATSNDPSAPPVDTCIDKFPPGRIADYDNMTLSCGLFVHHKLSGPSDVFGRPVRTKLELPTPGTHIDLNLITAWTLKQLLRYPDLRDAQSIVVLSDTRDLASIPHWRHTSRFLTERTCYQGPNGDKWFVLFVPSNEFQLHYTWTSVFVLRALAFLLPRADLMLWDHDAAPLTLFEVDELVALAKSSCLQYRFAYKSIGAILCTELSSTANAGIVFFT